MRRAKKKKNKIKKHTQYNSGLVSKRREWQMERAFQTALWLLKPEIVFILGDIFDEGKWSSQKVTEPHDILPLNAASSVLDDPNDAVMYM